MTVRPDDLRTIPLFRGITHEHLNELLAALEKQEHPEGATLFRAGDLADRFVLLTEGEIALLDGDEVKFRVRAIAPVGELGSVSGLVRNVTAVATSPVQVLSIASDKLLAFFERSGDIAFPFYHNLLGISADKISRDIRHINELTENVVRTQKAMKSLRELVLSNPETEISKAVCDMLDDCIEHNRRAHYRVSPSAAFPATVRFDDGSTVNVLEVSDTHLCLACKADRLVVNDGEWAAVLIVPNGEIPVAGAIKREAGDTVVIALDEFAEPIRSQFQDFLTRLQMLDFVV